MCTVFTQAHVVFNNVADVIPHWWAVAYIDYTNDKYIKYSSTVD